MFVLSLIAGLLAGSVSCSGQKGPPGLEPYSDEAHGIALFKPKDWTVESRPLANGLQVVVESPASDTVVSLSFLNTTDRRNDSVKFAGLILESVRKQMPSLKLNWSKTTQDRQRTIIEAQFTNSKGAAIKGRYYFLMNHPEARFIACEAPAAKFESSLPLLLSIVSNVSFLNPAVAEAAANAAQRTAFSVPELQRTKLSDGSATLLVPAGWNVTGAKGACLCVSPDKATGFAFSIGDFWGPSSMPYFDSSKVPGAHRSPYVKPIDAMALLLVRFGSRDIRVTQRAANPRAAQEAALRLKRGADAEYGVLNYTGATGAPTTGFFDVLGLQPMPSGQWGIIFTGLWAPATEFDQYRPTLEKMATSYAIDEQWASEYIRRGLENLKRLMGETSRKMAENAESIHQTGMAAFQERMRSQDYIDYKRTSTIRGEQEWISQAEGGALYKSDHWGLSREGERVAEGQPYNYYNFQGKNPSYNETMTPVDSSREVYESVYGKGW